MLFYNTKKGKSEFKNCFYNTKIANTRVLFYNTKNNLFYSFQWMRARVRRRFRIGCKGVRKKLKGVHKNSCASWIGPWKWVQCWFNLGKGRFLATSLPTLSAPGVVPSLSTSIQPFLVGSFKIIGYQQGFHDCLTTTTWIDLARNMGPPPTEGPTDQKVYREATISNKCQRNTR